MTTPCNLEHHSRFQEGLNLLFGKITNSNASNLTLLDQCLQSCPSLGNGNINDNDISCNWIYWEASRRGRRKGNWPVDLRMSADIEIQDRHGSYQVKINIVCLEILQTLIECFLDVFGFVICVPEFRCDLLKLANCFWRGVLPTHEDIFPINPGCFDAFSDLCLILIYGRGIDMAISCL